MKKYLNTNNAKTSIGLIRNKIEKIGNLKNLIGLLKLEIAEKDKELVLMGLV